MATQTFRSAFNGFNREDVIRHLEHIGNKHTNEMNQLQLENEALQAQIVLLRSRPEVDAPEAAEAADNTDAISALEAENAALRQEIETLKAQLAEIPAQVETPAAEPVATCNELEMYRRAERVEREARERAAQIYHQANGALADAATKVDEAVAQIDLMAGQVSAQLADLQSLVAGSKEVLRDAVSAICTIRPEE